MNNWIECRENPGVFANTELVLCYKNAASCSNKGALRDSMFRIYRGVQLVSCLQIRYITRLLLVIATKEPLQLCALW